MNTPDNGTTSLPFPFQHKRRLSRLLIATALAMLGAGAIYLGLGSFASAAPQSAPPSSATATIQDSQQWHAADADADVGPGQCEPCVLVVP